MENITTELVELTAEQHRAEMATLYTDICGLVDQSRAAFTNPSHDPSYEDIVTSVDKKLEMYNFHSQAATFAEIKATEDPMLEAVKRLSYPVMTVKEKTENNGGGTVHYLATGSKDEQIDLLALAAKCGGIGHDTNWFATIEQLCLRMTLVAAGGIALSPEEIASIDASFNMSQLARQIQLHLNDPDEPNPISIKQMLKVLDKILEQMLGEGYHAEVRDVKYMLGTFTGKSRKFLTMKTLNSKRLAGVIHEMAHRIVLGKAYCLEANVKKPR